MRAKFQTSVTTLQRMSRKGMPQCTRKWQSVPPKYKWHFASLSLSLLPCKVGSSKSPTQVDEETQCDEPAQAHGSCGAPRAAFFTETHTHRGKRTHSQDRIIHCTAGAGAESASQCSGGLPTVKPPLCPSPSALGVHLEGMKGSMSSHAE